MRMVGRSFDEFDAGEVLPMSHGLFKKGFVSAREIGVDLVRDDSKVPDALLASRGGPSGAPLLDRLSGAARLALLPLCLVVRLGFGLGRFLDVSALTVGVEFK